LPGGTEENHETSVYLASRAKIETNLEEAKIRNISTKGKESAVTMYDEKSKRYGKQIRKEDSNDKNKD
jgi:hypothetical protein